MSLETSRLILRPTSLEDAPFLLELMNTPKWLRFIGDRKVRTIEDATTYIQNRILPQHERLGYGNFTVIRKSDQVKMGSCGLYDRPGLEGVDLGFAFLPTFEKQGYAFEAATRIKQAAFEQFKINAIGAITIKENVASQRLLEKLGFQFLKVIRLPDDPEELMYYSLEAESSH